MSLCLFLAASLSIGANQPKDDGAKKELQKFQGKWVVISAKFNNRDWTLLLGFSSSLRAGSLTIPRPVACTFRENRFVFPNLSPFGGSWTVVIDPAKKPGHIDFLEGRDGREVRHPGIYDFDGGRLRICFGPNGASRPTKFSTKEGTTASPRLLLVLGRPFKPKLPAQDKGEVGKELRRFQGDWVLAWHQVNGRTFQEGRRATADAVLIRGNRVTIQIGRDRSRQHLDLALIINPTKKPKQLDLIPEGFPEEVRIFGIYSFDGHRLRMCFSMRKDKRPTEFITRAGTASCPIHFISLHRLSIGATKRANLVKKEWRKIAGKWELVSLECNGRAIPVQDVKVPEEALVTRPIWLVEVTDRSFSSFGIRTNFVGLSRDGSHYLYIDPTTQPKSFDIALTGAKVFGIYQLDGDRLKVCLGEPGKPRPKAFSTKNSKIHFLYLAVYRRVKSK
jgi:uncharacterized protein (TIGR03067 family)